ncbi:hypothetical protein [Sorangium sp. So ce1078]|uniref:hypothetical protein n=1 Tax=Sorangium sp. So ce1078 TaxID=3133329 RepID=UPI003F5E1A06
MTSTVTRNTGSTIKYAVITAVLAGLSFLCFRAMIGRSGPLWLLCLAGGLGFAVFAFGSLLVARDLAGTATCLVRLPAPLPPAEPEAGEGRVDPLQPFTFAHVSSARGERRLVSRRQRSETATSSCGSSALTYSRSSTAPASSWSADAAARRRPQRHLAADAAAIDIIKMQSNANSGMPHRSTSRTRPFQIAAWRRSG